MSGGSSEMIGIAHTEEAAGIQSRPPQERPTLR